MLLIGGIIGSGFVAVIRMLGGRCRRGGRLIRAGRIFAAGAAADAADAHLEVVLHGEFGVVVFGEN